METARLAVDLLTGLAWPLVLLAALLIFRGEIRSVLRNRDAHVKVGPLEVAIEQARVDVEAAKALSDDGDYGERDDEASPVEGGTITVTELVPGALFRQANDDPAGAVEGGYQHLVSALRDKLARAEVDTAHLDKSSAVQLAAACLRAGLINEQTVESVQGVTVLRNLAVLRQTGELNTAAAQNYLNLITGNIYAMRATRTAG